MKRPQKNWEGKHHRNKKKPQSLFYRLLFSLNVEGSNLEMKHMNHVTDQI